MAHRFSRRACLTGAALVGIEAIQLGLGCDASTTGARIRLETRITSDAAVDPVVEISDGWEVTVSRAHLAIADLYFLEGNAVARRSLLVPAAFAHPGHYREGDVLGEAHAPTVLDLLGQPTSISVSEAVTGTARSALVGFHDPSDGAPSAPDDAVALVEGIARRDGDEDRPFIAHAFAADLLDAVSELPEVPGCPLEGGDLTGDGTVLLEVQVRLWLDQIDFSLVPAGQMPHELDADEPPRRAFVRGVRKAAAYFFTFDKGLP